MSRGPGGCPAPGSRGRAASPRRGTHPRWTREPHAVTTKKAAPAHRVTTADRALPAVSGSSTRRPRGPAPRGRHAPAGALPAQEQPPGPRSVLSKAQLLSDHVSLAPCRPPGARAAGRRRSHPSPALRSFVVRDLFGGGRCSTCAAPDRPPSRRPVRRPAGYATRTRRHRGPCDVDGCPRWGRCCERSWRPASSPSRWRSPLAPAPASRTPRRLPGSRPGGAARDRVDRRPPPRPG